MATDTVKTFRKKDDKAPGGYVEINESDRQEGDVEFTLDEAPEVPEGEVKHPVTDGKTNEPATTADPKVAKPGDVK